LSNDFSKLSLTFIMGYLQHTSETKQQTFILFVVDSNIKYNFAPPIRDVKGLFSAVHT